MNLTIDYIQKYPLFELPTELTKETISYMLSQKEFTKMTAKELQEKLRKFPIDMELVRQIQVQLTTRFKNILQHKWVEPIIQAVEKVIKDEFESMGLPPPKPSIYGTNKATKKV